MTLGSIGLLLFSSLLYSSATLLTYQIIRNASIQIPFEIPNDLGHTLRTQHCDECLCNATDDDRIHLFTCQEYEPMKYTCQFFYFMPRNDEILYPVNNASIFIIKTNQTFGQKDDCCDTEQLVKRINSATKKTVYNKSLRFIVRGDHDTMASTANKMLVKFDITNPENFTEIPLQVDFTTIGYFDSHYYLGSGSEMQVFNESLLSAIQSYQVGTDIASIRALSDNELIVGTSKNGVFICSNSSTIFSQCSEINGIPKSIAQLHAIGVVNETAFYVGWYTKDQNIRLYAKQNNTTWVENSEARIPFQDETSDITVDDCGRVWATIIGADKIFIYDPNNNTTHTVTIFPGVFGILILSNYTFVTSHNSNSGLTLVKPSLYCRSVR